MIYATIRTEEFSEWLTKQREKSKLQIRKRISNIELYGHFGSTNILEDGVFELKWKNGRRVYYAYLKELNVLLLLGGNKNGQNDDITEAKKILERYKKN